MSERLKEIFGKLSRRLDLVVTGTLIFLLALTGWLYLQEESYNAPEPPQASPKNFSEKIPVPRVIPPKEDQPAEFAEQFEEVDSFFLNANPDIAESEQAEQLIIVNMFDIKTVEEEERRREDLNRQYNVAERMYDNENYREALSMVEQIRERPEPP